MKANLFVAVFCFSVGAFCGFAGSPGWSALCAAAGLINLAIFLSQKDRE